MEKAGKNYRHRARLSLMAEHGRAWSWGSSEVLFKTLMYQEYDRMITSVIKSITKPNPFMQMLTTSGQFPKNIGEFTAR